MVASATFWYFDCMSNQMLFLHIKNIKNMLPKVTKDSLEFERTGRIMVIPFRNRSPCVT